MMKLIKSILVLTSATFREANEVDDEIREITKEVSKFAFPEHGVPTVDTILTGFKDINSDTLFTAVGSVTARKIAKKERTEFKKVFGSLLVRLLGMCDNCLK